MGGRPTEPVSPLQAGSLTGCSPTTWPSSSAGAACSWAPWSSPCSPSPAGAGSPLTARGGTSSTAAAATRWPAWPESGSASCQNSSFLLPTLLEGGVSSRPRLRLSGSPLVTADPSAVVSLVPRPPLLRRLLYVHMQLLARAAFLQPVPDLDRSSASVKKNLLDGANHRAFHALLWRRFVPLMFVVLKASPSDHVLSVTNHACWNETNLDSSLTLTFVGLFFTVLSREELKYQDF